MSENQTRYQSTLPAERAIEYSVGSQAVRLTPAMVRQYLVHGRNELVTDQEVIFFMHICRARSLNPFNKDCYLVKYTNDPAAIIVSIDKLRYQARKSEDCVGWKSGIIVQKENGELRYSNGLILEGEKLLGGWFEGKPRGWEEPFKLEVNLNGYVKKTKEGHTTRFWQAENQPTMIAKVAEAQGLRRLWPEQIQGLYVQEELAAGLHDEPIDIQPAAGERPVLDPEGFVEILEDNLLERFLEVTAEKNHSSWEEVVRAANANKEEFIAAFKAWKQKGIAPAPPAEKPKGRKAKKQEAPPQPDPAPEDKQEIETKSDPTPPANGQGSLFSQSERDKLITEIKRYPAEAVAKARAAMGLAENVWPPTAEGCGRMLDLLLER
jgi:phage recombination protein Bet